MSDIDSNSDGENDDVEVQIQAEFDGMPEASNQAHDDCDRICQERKVPETEHEANCYLHKIFKNGLDWYKKEGRQEFALEILQAYPAQTSKHFYAQFYASTTRTWGELFVSPLHHFLRAGPFLKDGEIIKTIHDLCPDAIKERDENSSQLPLHTACHFGANSDVIEFLVKTYPTAVSTWNKSSGMLPIHYYLMNESHAVKLETVKLLLENFPESVDLKTWFNKLSPLDFAVARYHKQAVLDEIISRSQVRHFGVRRCYNFSKFTLDPARLVELLPQLESFSCRPYEYDNGGFVQLMTNLSANTSVTKLALHVPKVNDGAEDVSAFMSLLSNNTTIRKISIFPTHECERFLRRLRNGMEQNRTIQSLTIEFAVMFGGGGLLRLLQSGSTPKAVTLRRFHIMGDWSFLERAEREWTACRIEKLHIKEFKNIHSSREGILLLLYQVAMMPLLKELTIRLGEKGQFGSDSDSDTDFDTDTKIDGVTCFTDFLQGMDATDQLISILKKGRLERLVVRGLLLDLEKFCPTLEENRSLKKLTLELDENSSYGRGCLSQCLRYNTSLERVKIGFPNKSYTSEESLEIQKVKFYQNLIEYGRVDARDQKANVDLLIRVVQSKHLDGSLLDIVNLVYSLLLESPNIWSSESRKRERDLVPYVALT